MRSAADEPGAAELFDEAERVATGNGQLVELESIRAARDAMATTSS